MNSGFPLLLEDGLESKQRLQTTDGSEAQETARIGLSHPRCHGLYDHKELRREDLVM